LALSKVTGHYARQQLPGCIVRAPSRFTGPTGVEMEALKNRGCRRVPHDLRHDKAVERGVRIESIHLVEKKGGKSGHYRA